MTKPLYKIQRKRTERGYAWEDTSLGLFDTKTEAERWIREEGGYWQDLEFRVTQTLEDCR